MKSVPPATLSPLAGVAVVVVLGFSIRFYACWATAIIPPDGALYLYQAKMIVNGQWDRVAGCGIDYLSSLPVLIAGAYLLLHDWVIAAQAVSLMFGSATLVLVYLLLREFCDRPTGCVATLVLAMTPVMVSRSADVVREPVFWFFLSLGLYGFVTHFHRRHAALYLIGAQLAFLTAAWTRIEGIIVIPLALFFLAWASPRAPIRRCLIFLLPIILLIMAGIAVAMLTGRDISAYTRTGEVMEKALAFTDSYHLLREQLQEAVDPQTAEPLRWFLPEARSTIWLVALGVLINRIAEGFFYPFVLIYLLGLYGIKSRLAADRRLVFVVVLIVSILALLYLHTLQTWMLFYRFIVFAMLPSAVLAAFGADFIASRISRVTAFRPVGVLIGLGLLVVLVSLPKNLAPRDPEKNVFREIGRQAAAHRTGTGAAHIATTVDRQRWISFYANLDVELPPCPQSDERNVWGQADRDLARLIGRLKRQGMDFFLWEEKIWSGGELDLISPVVNKNLRLIGQWQHPDTGKMLLFKLTPGDGASPYRPDRQPSASKAPS